MNAPIIQLLVLAGIAIFLILRLRSVLGTREGYEKPPLPRQESKPSVKRDFEVIEGGPDRDVTDHAPEGSDMAQNLTAMKAADSRFNVGEFLQGARAAYEMILTDFERGDLSNIKGLLAEDVYEAFAGVVEDRNRQGLSIDFTFVGLSEIRLDDVEYDETTREAEVSVRFTSEATSVVRDNAGDVIEGSPTDIKRQRDIWTFARTMGSADPNWTLVATGG